ncbi:MAG TPA: ion transporter [Trichocoleus sp.]
MQDNADWQGQDWRQRVQFYLNDTETPVGQWVNGAIALLILLSSVIYVVETYPISEELYRLLNVLDWIILAGFTLEYLMRLWSAERPWLYVFSLYGLLDLLAILPFFVGLWDVRFIRLLRWLRILRLVRFLDNQVLFGFISGTDTLIVIRIVFTLFAIIFIYSGLIFQVEHTLNPAFGTFLDAVYFAVATMTTVGFGDVTPITEVGRGLTVMMILTGIALIPTQVGELIREFVKVTNSAQIPCDRCGLQLHDADAQFCKRCGSELKAGKRQELESRR